MENETYDNGQERHWGRVVLAAVLGIVALCIFLFIFLFRITTVTVEGNVHYTDDEIKELAMDGLFSGNSVLLSLTKSNVPIDNMSFMESISVRMTGMNSVCIEVTEKNVVGYVEYEDAYWYFNRDGMVVERMTTPALTAAQKEAEEAAQKEAQEGTVQANIVAEPDRNYVPLVRGLTFDRLVLNQAMVIPNTNVFDTLYSLNQMINKDNIPPDYVMFDEESNIFLYYGEAEVRLGQDEQLEQKMNTLASIMPEMVGMSGTLFLDDYSQSENGIIFQKSS